MNPRFRVSLFLLLLAPFVTANAQVWTGSTGSASTSGWKISGPSVFLNSSLSSATVNLRYNVLPVHDLIKPLDPAAPGQCRQLLVRFLDNGSAARVYVTLRRMDVRTGQITTLLTFDSNTVAASSSFQRRGGFCNAFEFDFADAQDDAGSGVYYIEVQLIKTSSAGNPGVSAISIETLNP